MNLRRVFRAVLACTAVLLAFPSVPAYPPWLNQPSPPWDDRQRPPDNSEKYSWGLASIGGHNVVVPNAPSSVTPKVYVIDSGVGYHVDLLNVTRYAVRNVLPVGCYSHGTHVAGIISATLNNFGVVGVLAGVPIISVNANTFNRQIAGVDVCSDKPSSPDVSALDEALVFVYNSILGDNLANPTGPIAVVNISQSGDPWAIGGALNARVKQLATPNPAIGYKGAFVVQSAGNIVLDNPAVDNACYVAYSNAQTGKSDPDDGIVVVGGIGKDGNIVVGSGSGETAIQGFPNVPYTADAYGSRRGDTCIEVWAPSVSIWSTYGSTATPTSTGTDWYQLQGTTYSNYAPLSGTSQAAPFVTGIAASILQRQPNLSPKLLEEAVRNATYQRQGVNETRYCAQPPCPVKFAGLPGAVHVNPTPGRLANVATRGYVEAGDKVLIAGFIIQDSPKTVVLRARGPSLTAAGVPNALANPAIALYQGQNFLGSNGDWQQNPNAATIQALGLAPAESAEAVIYATLQQGAYTAIATSEGNTSGSAIVEVFEVSTSDSPLVNLSTRGQVLTGGDVLIGGFVIQGSAPVTVVVRAKGPSLTALGVPGAVQNPVLTLYSGATALWGNDDWQTDANQAQLAALGYAPGHAQEAAILITLNPGAYTAIVSGAGGTGIGLVEVFRVAK